MTVPKPDIVWIGCHQNGFSQGRGGVLWEGVVEHTTGGGATIGALDNWFNNPAAEVSATFGVGPNGEIHQYVSLDDEAYAHGIVDNPSPPQVVLDNLKISPNRYLIGIEHVDGGIAGTVTAKQLDASQRLTAWLFDTVILPNAAKTGAKIDRDHILGHYQIGSHPQCPSWSAQRFSDYIARVRALIQPASPPLPPAIDPKIQDLLDALTLTRNGLNADVVAQQHITALSQQQEANIKARIAGIEQVLAQF